MAGNITDLVFFAGNLLKSCCSRFPVLHYHFMKLQPNKIENALSERTLTHYVWHCSRALENHGVTGNWQNDGCR